MKNKLLNAMKSLPMSIKDKQDFVNIVLNERADVGGASESSIEYFDVSGLDVDMARTAAAFSVLIKTLETIGGTDFDYEGVTNTSFALLGGLTNNIKIKGVAIDWGMELKVITSLNKPIVTMREYLTYMDMMELFDNLPRLTKEQFYNLE